MTVTAPDLTDPLAGEHWATWLAAIVPQYCTAPFAPHHVDFWEWVWSIELGRRVPPDVEVWARGGAKSTSGEAATASLGARGKRRYALYVADVQDRADDHVGNVAAMFEGERMAAFYPQHAERDVGKFGNPKGWRRNRLRTSGSFIVDAIGLDVAARGIKIEDQRPDLIIFDDVDGRHDTTRTTTKKIETITSSIIPAGSSDVAVLAIQNLIHPNGVFARLVDGRADFLADRRVGGPVPALREMTVADDGTVDGIPTWEGQDLETCRSMVSLMGLRAFRRECQHDVAEVEGALWKQQWIDDGRASPDWLKRYGGLPALLAALPTVRVAIDPNVSSSEGADEAGIVAGGQTARTLCPLCGVTTQPHYFILEDASAVVGPAVWAKRGVALHHRIEGDRIIGEANNGGELVETQIRQEDRDVPFKMVRASRGKQVRAEPAAALYDPSEGGECRVHHVGVLDNLETQMTTWVHGDPNSPGALDALVWLLSSFIKQPQGSGSFASAGAASAPMGAPPLRSPGF